MKISMSQVLRALTLRNRKSPTSREKDIIAAFVERWPDQEDNLKNFQARPSCNCRYDIMEAMVAKPEELQTFLKVVNPRKDAEVDLTTLPKRNEAPSVNHGAGLVEIIDDTPEAYAELLGEMRVNRVHYRGLQIRPIKDGRLMVYFY